MEEDSLFISSTLIDVFRNDESSQQFFGRMSHWFQGLNISDLHLSMSGRDIEHHLNSLETLVTKVVPLALSAPENVQEVASKIVNLILTFLEHMLIRILGAVEDKELEVEFWSTSLEISFVLMDLLRNVLEQFRSVNQPLKLTCVWKIILGHTADIMSVALKHCKNSPVIYGPEMNGLTGFVQDLFKRTKVVLKLFVALAQDLEVLLTESRSLPSPSEIPLVEELMLKLDSLQRDLLHLELYSFGIVCKVYVSMSRAFAPCLGGDEVASHFRFLCQSSEMSAQKLRSYLMMVEPDAVCDDSILGRELSLIVFYMKTLQQQLQLLEEDPFLHDRDSDDSPLYEDCLLKALCCHVTLPDATSINLSKWSGHSKLLELNGMIRSLTQLAARSGRFATLVLSPSACSSSTDTGVALAILCSSILAIIPECTNEDLYRIWFPDDGEQNTNLFSRVVSNVGRSHTGLCAPASLQGVQFGGKPITPFTAYEFILTRTLAFITGMQSSALSCVEQALLTSLLQAGPDDFWSVTFCLDVWAFLARYGPMSLCFDHACLLTSVFLESGQDHENLHLMLCLERLLSFLPLQELDRLVSTTLADGSPHGRLLSLFPIEWLQIRPNQGRDACTLASKLAEGGLSEATFTDGLTGLELLCKLWPTLDLSEKCVIVYTSLSLLWKKLVSIKATQVEWSESWVFRFMAPLFRLTNQANEEFLLPDTIIQDVAVFTAQSKQLYQTLLVGPEIDVADECPIPERAPLQGNARSGHLEATPPELEDVDMDEYLVLLTQHTSENCQRSSPSHSNMVSTPSDGRVVKKRKLILDGECDQMKLQLMSFCESFESCSNLTQEQKDLGREAIEALQAILEHLQCQTDIV